MRTASSRRMRGSTWPGRSIQVEITGTRVLEMKYDASIAKPTASDSGTKSCRPTPVMKSAGRNTARTHNMESRRAVVVCFEASSTARARDRPAANRV